MTYRPRGFIALISAVVIAAILLIVVIAGGYTGFFTRFNILDEELKERSAALVDACADTVAARLAVDSTYTGTGNETVAIGSDSCTIVSSSGSGSTRTFKLQAHYQNAYTNALVTFDTGTSAITAWQEVGSF